MKILEDEIVKKIPLGIDTQRLFHGRGQCFPSYEDIVIDWFSPVIFIICYRPRSVEWLEQLSTLLLSHSAEIKAIMVQRRFCTGSPTDLLWGECPEICYASENGLRYQLRIGQAQNIGFFPDMKDIRLYVQKIAKGKKVLNLFSYTCSFSVAVISGGAEHVDNLDMNKGALALGKMNHKLNGLDCRKASFLSLELFRSLSRLRKLAPYDLIICDPPAAQGGSFQGERDWPKIIKKLPSLLVPGGDFLACISAPELGCRYVKSLFAEECPQAVIVNELSAGKDFADIDPDKGLNVIHYRF